MLHSASVHYEPPGNINFNSPKSAKKCFGKISRGPERAEGGQSFPPPSSERQLSTEPPNRRGTKIFARVLQGYCRGIAGGYCRGLCKGIAGVLQGVQYPCNNPAIALFRVENMRQAMGHKQYITIKELYTSCGP